MKNLERDYHHCPRCDFVFVPPEFQPGAAAEKARYMTHNNDPSDAGYRDFLSRLWNVLKRHLSPGALGLDYGSGPEPVLATMIRGEGFDVRIYDPYFAPDRSALDERYDFITCCETAEHFAKPGEEFETLGRLLKPEGWLGVMTGMKENWEGFADWNYARDETHVGFYSPGTMGWIANRHGWHAEFPRENVALFRKPGQEGLAGG